MWTISTSPFPALQICPEADTPQARIHCPDSAPDVLHLFQFLVCTDWRKAIYHLLGGKAIWRNLFCTFITALLVLDEHQIPAAKERKKETERGRGK
jgi:hypothetical protein